MPEDSSAKAFMPCHVAYTHFLRFSVTGRDIHLERGKPFESTVEACQLIDEHSNKHEPSSLPDAINLHKGAGNKTKYQEEGTDTGDQLCEAARFQGALEQRKVLNCFCGNGATSKIELIS